VIGSGNGSIWRKPDSLSTIYRTWPGLDSNLGHGGMLATSRLNYGTASPDTFSIVDVRKLYPQLNLHTIAGNNLKYAAERKELAASCKSTRSKWNINVRTWKSAGVVALDTSAIRCFKRLLTKKMCLILYSSTCYDRKMKTKSHIYKVLQKELYNFETLYKFTQKTCTAFWAAIVYKIKTRFTWDSYGSMWLLLVMQGVWGRVLQWYSKSLLCNVCY
jgi:hypothetical protein